MKELTPSLEELTEDVFALRQEVTPAVPEDMVKHAHRAALEQRTAACPGVGRHGQTVAPRSAPWRHGWERSGSGVPMFTVSPASKGVPLLTRRWGWQRAASHLIVRRPRSRVDARHRSEKFAGDSMPQMKGISVDSEKLNGADGRAQNAIDGNNTTIWQTESYSSSPKPPHEIVIWLGGNYTVGGFTYRPHQDGSLEGTVSKCNLYVSADSVYWGNPVVSGSFAKNANKKQVLFAGRVGQYVRFVAKSEVNGEPWTSTAEIRVLGTPVAVPALLEIPQSQMSIVFVDSEELTDEDRRAENAIDGDPNTFCTPNGTPPRQSIRISTISLWVENMRCGHCAICPGKMRL